MFLLFSFFFTFLFISSKLKVAMMLGRSLNYFLVIIYKIPSSLSFYQKKHVSRNRCLLTSLITNFNIPNRRAGHRQKVLKKLRSLRKFKRNSNAWIALGIEFVTYIKLNNIIENIIKEFQFRILILKFIDDI